jgi:hypothetical protein
MTADYLFVGLIVGHRDNGIDWYSRFVGTPPFMPPNDQEAPWAADRDDFPLHRCDHWCLPDRGLLGDDVSWCCRQRREHSRQLGEADRDPR